MEQTFRNLFPDTFVAAHPVHNHKVKAPPAEPDGDQSCSIVAVGTHMGVRRSSKMIGEGLKRANAEAAERMAQQRVRCSALSLRFTPHSTDLRMVYERDDKACAYGDLVLSSGWSSTKGRLAAGKAHAVAAHFKRLPANGNCPPFCSFNMQRNAARPGAGRAAGAVGRPTLP